MLDDKDAFTSIDELRADMELASFRGYTEDVLLEKVWFATIDVMGGGMKGRCAFIKGELNKYAEDLDRALKLMVWDA